MRVLLFLLLLCSASLVKGQSSPVCDTSAQAKPGTFLFEKVGGSAEAIQTSDPVLTQEVLCQIEATRKWDERSYLFFNDQYRILILSQKELVQMKEEEK